MKLFNNIFCFNSKENKLKNSTSSLSSSDQKPLNKANVSSYIKSNDKPYLNRNAVANNEALKNKEYILKIYNTYGPRIAHHIIKIEKSKNNKEPHTLRNKLFL